MPFSVPSPPANVMSGCPKPGLVWPSGWLMNINPAATPYPTAGSVIGRATGRKPNFSSRKPLTSSQLSSSERNFDGASEVAGAGAMVVCALTDAPQSSIAIAAEIVARMVRIRLLRPAGCCCVLWVLRRGGSLARPGSCGACSIPNGQNRITPCAGDLPVSRARRSGHDRDAMNRQRVRSAGCHHRRLYSLAFTGRSDRRPALLPFGSGPCAG